MDDKKKESKEKKWVKKIAAKINAALKPQHKAEVELHIPYANEMRSVERRKLKGDEAEVDDSPIRPMSRWFKTDIAIVKWHDKSDKTEFTPRVIMEAKWNGVTTHDVIVYNRKAAQHKSIFPYLRYGFVIAHDGKGGKNGKGKIRHVPPRVYLHDRIFDFLCCVKDGAKEEERNFIALLKKEITASKIMEKMIYGEEGRKVIHRNLVTR